MAKQKEIAQGMRAGRYEKKDVSGMKKIKKDDWIKKHRERKRGWGILTNDAQLRLLIVAVVRNCHFRVVSFVVVHTLVC